MKELKVKITLLDESLGMLPANKELYETYIASKAPDAPSIEEEVASIGVEGVVEKQKTVFPRMEDGRPFWYDYQLRGFFKDSIGMLRRVPGTACNKIKNYKKVVDGLLFIKERKVPIIISGPMGDCQRPMRTSSPQGERTAIANSETVPEGSVMQFTIQMFTDELEDVVRECLNYGIYRGLGQWRNSGKGRFTWEEVA